MVRAVHVCMDARARMCHHDAAHRSSPSSVLLSTQSSRLPRPLPHPLPLALPPPLPPPPVVLPASLPQPLPLAMPHCQPRPQPQPRAVPPVAVAAVGPRSSSSTRSLTPPVPPLVAVLAQPRQVRKPRQVPVPVPRRRRRLVHKSSCHCQLPVAAFQRHQCGTAVPARSGCATGMIVRQARHGGVVGASVCVQWQWQHTVAPPWVSTCM